ncbi:MAG: hypothetical protein JWP67_3121 [Mucilaginibacter sp.]|nr:hypothetical protein [Mucilaginibacter sp.]
MKTILVINDNSAEAENAYKLALLIAHQAEAEILVANICKVNMLMPEKIKMAEVNELLVAHHEIENDFALEAGGNDLSNRLMRSINEVDFCGIKEKYIAQEINKKNTWLIIQGMNAMLPNANLTNLNISCLLNKVKCPVMLVPPNWKLKHFERIVYLADLRYCRIEIVRYLARFAKLFNADISIMHLSARGLPHMEQEYALNIFSDEVCSNVNYDRLFLNNTKERDVTKAVHVMIDGLQNDLLAVVNHRFHFKEIFGRYINKTLPQHITVPLLVFPY